MKTMRNFQKYFSFVHNFVYLRSKHAYTINLQ